MSITNDKPHIILLIADCLRAKNVDRNTMPFIFDKMKINGVVLERESLITFPQSWVVYRGERKGENGFLK